MIVILGRSRLTDLIFAISIKDRMPLSEFDALIGSSKLEPRLPRSNTLEVRRRRLLPEPGVLGAPELRRDERRELRRDERRELRDRLLELRRSAPWDVALEAVLKATAAAVATVEASVDTSSMSASI